MKNEYYGGKNVLSLLFAYGRSELPAACCLLQAVLLNLLLGDGDVDDGMAFMERRSVW